MRENVIYHVQVNMEASIIDMNVNPTVFSWGMMTARIDCDLLLAHFKAFHFDTAKQIVEKVGEVDVFVGGIEV